MWRENGKTRWIFRILQCNESSSNPLSWKCLTNEWWLDWHTVYTLTADLDNWLNSRFGQGQRYWRMYGRLCKGWPFHILVIKTCNENCKNANQTGGEIIDNHINCHYRVSIENKMCLCCTYSRYRVHFQLQQVLYHNNTWQCLYWAKYNSEGTMPVISTSDESTTRGQFKITSIITLWIEQHEIQFQFHCINNKFQAGLKKFFENFFWVRKSVALSVSFNICRKR